ncbi:MAG: hypothetical protein HPY74_20050 [Firmicutes bacterium]|nr:hypothetical protein [Bacillota bacterium]
MKLLVSSYYKSNKIKGFSFAEHQLIRGRGENDEDGWKDGNYNRRS